MKRGVPGSHFLGSKSENGRNRKCGNLVSKGFFSRVRDCCDCDESINKSLFMKIM
jgi:hypothetical protein